ncbi:MAG TPA: hypothetical protein VEN79_08600 [Terriglobia bacterium]|nr:hypothetical protein [Terriglobia bacterium]
MSSFLIPVAVFVMVVLIVAIAHIDRVRSLELEVHQKLHMQEMEHQRKMQELDLKLQRIKQGT